MNTLLIANRGEIARRVARTAHEMGLRTVAVFEDADRDAPHVRECDSAVLVSSYLDGAAVIDAARVTAADGVHPGYGFLSENAPFAEACRGAGLTFVGPRPETIRAMGDKVEAKRRMAAADVPVLDGDPDTLPVLVKAAAGGGGRGMRLVTERDALEAAKEAASREAAAAFGDGTVFLERWLAAPRHVEVQVVGDEFGTIVTLGDRECSIQRRHQKVIEEAPSAGISAALRARLATAAQTGAAAIGYVGAGTFEFLVDGEDFYFLEMNTRLQVEHPVTEAVTGLDLVRLQLVVAAGDPLPVGQDEVSIRGHAVEARLYAEDPAADFLPSPGVVHRFRPGPTRGVRYDSGVEDGTEVSVRYDAMIAKVIAHATTRAEATGRLARALRELEVHGVRTNRELLLGVLAHADWSAARTTTDFLPRHPDVAERPDLETHRGAAVVAMVAEARRSAPVLGFAPARWRNVGGPTGRRRVSGPDGEVDVRYETSPDGRLSLGIDDDRIEGWPAGEGVLVRRGPVTRFLRVHHLGDRWWVNGADGQSEWQQVPRFADAVTAAAGRGPVAPLPGTVLAVEVKAGDVVGAGQLLVVIEAMKMEHRITATADATVVDVPVAAGDRVDVGDLLVRLE